MSVLMALIIPIKQLVHSFLALKVATFMLYYNKLNATFKHVFRVKSSRSSCTKTETCHSAAIGCLDHLHDCLFWMFSFLCLD